MTDNTPSSLPPERKLTPMLKQYTEAKALYPHALLMFRMGDFYELFFEDAKTAAMELNLTLTARDKSEDPIPMAGVPHHAAEGYISKLVQRGYAVAVCDQIEDPKHAKGIVKREITRVVTPGTVCDLESLDPVSHSYLGHVSFVQNHVLLVLLDVLSGELLYTQCPTHMLGDELSRMGVKEVLVEKDGASEVASCYAKGTVRVLDGVDTQHSVWVEYTLHRLGQGAVAVCEKVQGLCFALYRVLGYAEETQRRRLEHVMMPKGYTAQDAVFLDEATRRNLELTQTAMEGKRQGSMLWHMDRCCSAMGSRLLSQWMLFPLRDQDAIEKRLDAVESLKNMRTQRMQVREALEGVRDIERLMGRVSIGRANPKDVLQLGQSLARVPSVRALMVQGNTDVCVRWQQADDIQDVALYVLQALREDAPVAVHEGGIFQKGFHADLDTWIMLCEEGQGFLLDLEKRERARTGIASLKVRYNRVFGYYLEVTKANLQQVPADYMRKQTLVGAERFITPELKEYEEKVLHADEKRKELEHVLFGQLLDVLQKAALRVRAVARLLAETDALCSLAEVADVHRYVRPDITQEEVLHLQEARHPVLERLMPQGERFVPNDVLLDTRTRQLLLVTGPNMAGKSTVMRQVALCTLLAHMGSFVPAKKALVGMCDRIFTRVGASDNLGKGQSTFMVEMLETASILKEATRKSVVLLDEIGRGTSTYDGVSIAWAVAEDVHDRIQCRTLFATHYHELTQLALTKPRIKNIHVKVSEDQGRIVFLRALAEGPANRSYGVAVAKLAGVPEHVIQRAQVLLADLEHHAVLVRKQQHAKKQGPRVLPVQLSLF